MGSWIRYHFQHQDTIDETNIDFDVENATSAEVEAFDNNVFKDLILRGYEKKDLPRRTAEGKAARRALLRSHLVLGFKVRAMRRALTIEENALERRLMGLILLIACILRVNNRMLEKMVQQLILYGLRMNAGGKRRSMYIKRIEGAMNQLVLKKGRRSGQ